jgi:hypothetical protein
MYINFSYLTNNLFNYAFIIENEMIVPIKHNHFI